MRFLFVLLPIFLFSSEKIEFNQLNSQFGELKIPKKEIVKIENNTTDSNESKQKSTKKIKDPFDNLKTDY